MTYHEAIETVERALTALRLRNRWGDELEGIMAAGPVARFHGGRWDRLVDRFERGEIEPDRYAVEAIDMIYEFRKVKRGAA
jgi:hypothetical protein